MIVSVSRRCDIPRFAFGWFMEKINTGFAEAVNPFNKNQVKRIPLDNTDLLVFWTRDPCNILANTDELTERGFRFYVMVTVTGYPPELEPDMADTGIVLDAMKELAVKIGKERLIWRYDPVLVTSITGWKFHRENFNSIAGCLSGSAGRVIISLYDVYKKPHARLKTLEKAGILQIINSESTDNSGKLSELLCSFAKSAAEAGMEIQSCAEKEDYSIYGIKKGACIDADLINGLWGIETKGKDKNQRPDCLCCKSADIGVYGTCDARCVYCYAW